VSWTGGSRAVEVRIKTAVAQSKTSLVELFGVGPGLAAKLLGEVGDVRRLRPSTTSPLTPAPPRWRPQAARSSRHRLSRAGDRKLDHALYLVAIMQFRHPTAGPTTGASAEASPPKKRCGV
jgi:transposase